MVMNVFVEIVMGNMEARETHGVIANALVIVRRYVAVIGLIVSIQQVCFLLKYDTTPKSILCHVLLFLLILLLI